MLRVVFDTVGFLRALINPYSRCGRIVFAHFDKYRLFVSRDILEEILEVLLRPELTSKFRALAELDMSLVLAVLGSAEVVEGLLVEPGARDPADDKFLGAAEATRAEYLVSDDQDLRVLGQYAGAKIVGCAEFLEILEQQD